ncbi:hypothetical protein BH11ACT6_BH11ACT6_34910 [soil metagenome]
MADSLTDIDLHRLDPNYLMGPDWRRVLQRVLNRAHADFVARVAKDSGALAALAETSIEVGGLKSDRLIGRLTVSAPNPDDEGYLYAAAHIFGTQGSEGFSDEGRLWVHDAQDPSRDLEQILAGLHV